MIGTTRGFSVWPLATLGALLASGCAALGTQGLGGVPGDLAPSRVGLFLGQGLGPAPVVAQAGSGRACTTDKDCPGSDVCVAGLCATVQRVPAPQGGCSRDTDCVGEDLCEAGRCVSRGRVAPVLVAPASGWLTVTTTPPGAMVLLNGVEVGTTPRRVEAMPATHKVELRLAGHVVETREVLFESGRSTELAVELRPTPEEEQRRAEEAARLAAELERRAQIEVGYQKELAAWRTAAEPVREGRQRDTALGGVATGLGVALLVGSVVPLALGATQGDKAHAQYLANSDPSRFATYREQIAGARTLVLVGSVLAGVGVPMLAVGAVFLGRRADVPPEPRRPSVAELDVVLTPLPGGGCLAASGRF